MEFITLEEYEAQTAPGWERYFSGRWGYVERVIEKIKSLGVEGRVLELGPGPGARSIVTGADTMGCLEGIDKAVTILHDATMIPWPIATKTYDLFLALQVFEHLADKQREAFAEVRRVARQAILTLPFQCRSERHKIGWTEYAEWFGESWLTADVVDFGKCRKVMLHFIF